VGASAWESLDLDRIKTLPKAQLDRFRRRLRDNDDDVPTLAHAAGTTSTFSGACTAALPDGGRRRRSPRHQQRRLAVSTWIGSDAQTDSARLFRQDPPNAAAALPLSIETTLTPPDAVNPSTQPASRPPPPNSTASDCHAIHPFMTREGGGIGRCCCGIKITFQRSIRARPACQATLFVIVTSKPINN
jgi:hypothetical protein